MVRKLLTVFTPAYNRKHTIGRTYESLCRQTCKDFEWLIIDDGSTDGTQEWVEGLGRKTSTGGQKFDWMGRPLEGEDTNHFIIDLPDFRLTYIYKPNGGLYTGYNVAYATIQTELCVCIDSDDFMPDDAVERICRRWRLRDKTVDFCGIVGLDYNLVDRKAIGGKFEEGANSGFYMDIKKGGDTKEVLRTDLMRMVSPMTGFQDEKDFNPFYMISRIVDAYPILIENSNFCWVEYQVGGDSMSQAIFKQYVRSPKSYAKYRLNEMSLIRGNSLKKKYWSCVHYVSACIFSRDRDWLANSPLKWLTVLSVPLGILLNIYIRIKAHE